MFPAPWLQCIVNFGDTTHADARTSCTLWYKTEDSLAGIDPGGDMTDLADLVHEDVSEKFKPVMNNHIFLLPTQIKLRKSAGTVLDAFSAIVAAACTYGSGDPMTDETAVVIQRRTGLIGRNRRGRIFVPNVPQAAVTEDVLTVAEIPKWRTLAHHLQQNRIWMEATWVPVQPNYKDNALDTVTDFRVVHALKSRRDRRSVTHDVIYPALAP